MLLCKLWLTLAHENAREKTADSFKAILHLLILFFECLLDFPHCFEMSKCLSLLLLFMKFSFKVFGSDSLSVLTFLVNLDFTLYFLFYVLHVTLLLQV